MRSKCWIEIWIRGTRMKIFLITMYCDWSPLRKHDLVKNFNCYLNELRSINGVQWSCIITLLNIAPFARYIWSLNFYLLLLLVVDIIDIGSHEDIAYWLDFFGVCINWIGSAHVNLQFFCKVNWEQSLYENGVLI